jgi:hypothetical protein
MLYDAILGVDLRVEFFNLQSLSLSRDKLEGGIHLSWDSSSFSNAERTILGGAGSRDNRRGFRGAKGAGVCTRCAILVGAGVENLGNAGIGGVV